MIQRNNERHQPAKQSIYTTFLLNITFVQHRNSQWTDYDNVSGQTMHCNGTIVYLSNTNQTNLSMQIRLSLQKKNMFLLPIKEISIYFDSMGYMGYIPCMNALSLILCRY